MEIIWHPLYKEYGADSLGNVYSRKNNLRQLKLQNNYHNYKYFIASYKPLPVKLQLVNRFVYECFNQKLLDKNITIDHINSNSQDNRIENLQEMSRRDNKRKNCSLPLFITKNSSKNSAKLFIVKVCKNSKRFHIGCYKTLEEAIIARDNSCKEFDITI